MKNRSYVGLLIFDFCVVIFFSSFDGCANHFRASACPQRGICMVKVPPLCHTYCLISCLCVFLSVIHL